MNFNVFRWRSLKTRVTLLTLAIFVVSIWSLAFIAGRILRQDMQRTLGEQQFAMVSMVAAEVNQDLKDRVLALQNVTRRISPAMLDNPAALQDLLAEHVIMQSLFNGGTYVTGKDGTAIAGLPDSARRIGINYLDRDYLAAALNEGTAMIGRPVIDKSLNVPILGLAVPIRDSQGKLIGALAGVINLAQPNFLDRITDSHYGRTGGYLLIAPQHNLFVTATDKIRIMQPIPAPGINSMHDRYMHGFIGFGTAVNSSGTDELSAAQRIPVAGWFAVAVLPTAEAFAPIGAMQQAMLLIVIFLTLMAGVLTWWMLRRELLPLVTTARTLSTLAQTNELPQPLPLTRQDETDELIAGFNRLLHTLTTREEELRESELRWKFAIEGSGDGVWDWNPQTDVANYSKRCMQMLGYAVLSPAHQDWLDNIHPDDKLVVAAAMQRYMDGQAEIYTAEYRLRSSDGSYKWILGRGVVVSHSEDGKPLRMIGTHSDITGRKQTEEALRIAATAFESQQGMLITNAAKVIERVNKAFTAITGYTMEEAVGQTPRLLNSGRYEAGFYDAMWASIAGSGSWQGEIWNRRKNGQTYPERLSISAVKDAAGIATHYVGIFSDITARKTSEKQIERLAFYDPLTGLPNRQLLTDRLQHAQAASVRHQRQCALLLIDLDAFKTLNDTLGHEQGDLLLQLLAKRLVVCVRESDTVARVGGDEFIVLMEDMSQNDQEVSTQAKSLGEKILATLSQPYHLAGSTHHSTVSIGIALFGGHENEGTEEPLKQAELAMYQAKAVGRNTLRFFDPQMQASVSARATLEAGLHEAILKNQFVLHFQAQVDGENRITGVEALVRWLDPRRGMVSPVEFIPLAEETGLILPLGQWVLETACTQLANWANQPAMAHLTVAVNVSARQFHEDHFVEQVLATLKRTGANPHRLKLELTESMLLSDIESVIAKMSALKRRGVGFSLDDFGTGFSSLSHLKRLPLDQLKIDQGFVRDILIDPNDAAISKMVIALAESMGLAVIAEGVETQSQRDLLAGMGCHAYQGYLFSRPLPLEDFEALSG